MLDDNNNYYCRICGLKYDEPIWLSETYGSHDICSCCGREFGYEDCGIESIRSYRENWLKKGANWFIPKFKPTNWNLEQQLKQIPQKYR